MKTLKLIKGGDKLLAEVSKFKTNYDEVMARAQELGISVIAHAASTGDVRPMQAFHDGLNVTHQGMFRNFLRIVNKQHNDATKCIDFRREDGELTFRMLKDTSAERDALAKLCESKLLNPPAYNEKDPETQAPDGSAYKPWIERNAVGDAFTLMTNKKLESQLKNILSSIKGEKDRVRVDDDFDPEFVKKIGEVVEFVSERNKARKEVSGEPAKKAA